MESERQLCAPMARSHTEGSSTDLAGVFSRELVLVVLPGVLLSIRRYESLRAATKADDVIHIGHWGYIRNSPEVILGMNYHMAIDMWSLGCIMAELYTGFPIFPGENEQEQLSCIMEVLGVPDKDFINRSSRKRLFFGE